MEKVKIKSVIDSGKKWNDKPIIQIELEDGRKGSSFESEALSWKGEIELEIKEGKEYNGQKQFIFNSIKPNFNKFPQKDWSFEKRKESLAKAIEFAKVSDVKQKSSDILTVAKAFFNYLNEK